MLRSKAQAHAQCEHFENLLITDKLFCSSHSIFVNYKPRELILGSVELRISNASKAAPRFGSVTMMESVRLLVNDQRHDLLGGCGSWPQREKSFGIGFRNKCLVVTVNHVSGVTKIIRHADGITGQRQ